MSDMSTSVLRAILALWLLILASGTSFAASSSCQIVLVVGDSLSAAYNMSEEASWPALLQKRLNKTFGDQGCWQVVNASIAGETTAGASHRLADLLAVDAALVIVELGGNDGLRGYPPSHLEHNLWQLITSFRKHGAQVILTGIRLPPNYGHRYGDAFAAVYPRVARETGARLVEFFMDGVGGHQALMQEDGLHPNDKAQPVLLDNIWPAVRDAVTDLEISKRP